MNKEDHPAYWYERMEEEHLAGFATTIEEQFEHVFDAVPDNPEISYNDVKEYYGKELRVKHNDLIRCINNVPEKCATCPFALQDHFDHVTPHFSMSWCAILLMNRFKYDERCLVTKEQFLRLALVLI